MAVYQSAKRKILNKEPFLMAFLATTDTATAEMMAMSGIDVIVVDNEHMPMTDEQLLNIARAITMHGKAALLRTACKDTEKLMRWMEFGFSGLCCTQCHGVEDAVMAINAVKYPPIGRRGLGTDGRAAGYGALRGLTPSEYMKQENENTIIFLTLEDQRGINDAVLLAQMKEIDDVHIGPIDLSASMGYNTPKDPEIKRIISEAKRIMEDCGNPREEFVSDPEQIPELVRSGAKCLVIETDLAKLRDIYTKHSSILKNCLK